LEGGLNCPSLVHRKAAYDAKFIMDLVSRPADTPWKAWTMVDLEHASAHSRSWKSTLETTVNPLMQHAYITLKLLEPQVRAAFLAARALWYNTDRCFPSVSAQADMPLMYHPAVKLTLSVLPSLLEATKFWKVSHLFCWATYLPAANCEKVRVRIAGITDALVPTRWSPWARFMGPSQVLGLNIRAWPAMIGVLRCASILGANPSQLVSHVGIATFKAPAQSVPL